MYFPDSDDVNLNLISYTYNEDGSISSIQSNNGTESYIYDDFGRITSNSLTAGTSTFMTDSYSYFVPPNETSGLTSNRISAVTSALSNGESYSTYYTYDKVGNITCIRYYYPSTSTSKYVYYQYDAIGQLEREDNQLLGYTYLYSYDDSGNMVYKETRSYTRLPTDEIELIQPIIWETFGRSNGSVVWYDRREGYTGSGLSGSTTYDTIGNPLTYFNGSNYTFTWQNGRELASATKGSTVVTYEYNQDGIRIAKEANGLRYEYDLSGTQIVREREYYLDTNRLVADRRYFYDANGIISSAKVYFYGYTTAFTETEYTFYFRTNIQGDVLAVYNAEGTAVMEVTYDAWGNFTDTVSTYQGVPSAEQFQALAMPFRYRGYVYDQETELYYLNTRYYDAKMHRFINADSTSYLGANGDLVSYNLYAYCSNNPVMGRDPNGMWTVSMDFNASYALIGGSSRSYSFVVDDKGNFAIQKSIAELWDKDVNSGMVLGFLASVGLNGTVTNQDTIFDLEGRGMTWSGENIGIITSEDDIVGVTVSSPKNLTVGIPYNATESITVTEKSFNINSVFEKIKVSWNTLWNKVRGR